MLKKLFALPVKWWGQLFPEPSMLVDELATLLVAFPDEWQLSVKHDGDIPTLTLWLENEAVAMAPGLGTRICVQQTGIHLETPFYGRDDLNRTERRMVMNALTEWSQT